MIKGMLLHPEILEALGRAGHGSKILIADGNYPFSTKLGPNAKLVSLNLSPGIVSCTDVLKAILSAVPIEAASVMATLKKGPYAMDKDPAIWADFSFILADNGFDGELKSTERLAFYSAASTPDVCLTIATGEQRIYANLLLTIGVVMPPAEKQS